MWSGGTDGVISPHATIFATVDPAKAERPEQPDEPRLTVGFAMSEPILAEEIGYVAMVTKVADAVKVAMERDGITDPRVIRQGWTSSSWAVRPSVSIGRIRLSGFTAWVMWLAVHLADQIESIMLGHGARTRVGKGGLCAPGGDRLPG